MPGDWTQTGRLLACVKCHGELTWPSPEQATCQPCGATYPVRDGIFIAQDSWSGANQVAAEFYDGPLRSGVEFWEKVFFVFQGGERRARRQFMQHFPNLSGKRLAIVAIGAGNDLMVIPDDCEVIGLDISMAQLKLLKERFPKRPLHLVLGQAEQLPIPDQSVDHCLSAGGFNFFSDPIGSLKEMVRITKPGGMIVISDEVPKLGKAGKKRRFVRKWMDRALGKDFSQVVMDRSDLDLEGTFGAVFHDWKLLSIWRKAGYAAVAKVCDADHAALNRAAG